MTTNRNAIVLGCGGHARVVVDALHRQGGVVAAYVDDVNELSKSAKHNDRPVYSSWRDALEALGRDTPIALAIGDNAARLDRALDILGTGGPLMTIVHDSAVVSNGALLGAGTFIGPRAIINSGVRVGTACVINSGACLEHDCVVGDGVHIAPCAVLCGWCSVGDRSLVGAGAAVRDRIAIGSDSIIGLGAAVVADVRSNVTVTGNPAIPR